MAIKTKKEKGKNWTEVKGPDKPLSKLTIPVEVLRVESNIGCGFRMDFGKGEINGRKFSIGSGAGCGSPWISIDLAGKDYAINIGTVLKALNHHIYAPLTKGERVVIEGWEDWEGREGVVMDENIGADTVSVQLDGLAYLIWPERKSVRRV